MTHAAQLTWQTVCHLDDITTNSGVCAQVGEEQVAVYRVKTLADSDETTLFAINNMCPFAKANVMSRGIVGSLGERIVVASPVYKQHFDLSTGECIEDESVSVPTYAVRCDGGKVQIQCASASE